MSNQPFLFSALSFFSTLFFLVFFECICEDLSFRVQFTIGSLLACLRRVMDVRGSLLASLEFGNFLSVSLTYCGAQLSRRNQFDHGEIISRDSNDVVLARKAWFPYRCICRICRTKKIHRTRYNFMETSRTNAQYKRNE